MDPTNPVISPKNYNVVGLTFNRNRLYRLFSIVCSISVCKNIHTETTTLLYLWITIKYRKCSIPMHLVAGRSPTQAAHIKHFQCSCCKSWVKFLHSVLAVAAVAVSFGTCTSLWYRAKQEEKQPLPKQRQKLYIYLIRSVVGKHFFL